MSRASETSPLFDKMDALLARHRGSSSATENIPVLLDEADDIPVLTEAVDEQADGDILMFPPEELFEVEELEFAPLIESPAFEPVAMKSPLPVAEFLDLPLLDLAALSQANPWGASWEEEKIPTAPELTIVEAVPPTPLILEVNASEWNDDQLFDSLVSDPITQPMQAEPAALSERAIAELSATVAAQLGVEIATEVEQLTRQHFANLMSNFYADTLSRLMRDMTVEIEQKLLPRVEELVKEELRKSGHG